MGLVLRPDVIPGTYITGKMFGYGIYGANSFSKSFNYTGFDDHNPVACLFLGEFALGKILPQTQANYYITGDHLKKQGYDSVWGLGKNTPKNSILVDGVQIPQSKLEFSDSMKDCSLLYDEFVVYNEDQVNLKYIVEIQAVPI